MDIKQLRKLHRKIAPIVFLPLLVTAFTGILYRVVRSWFGASDEIGEMIMFIHQGSYLGKDLRVFYVILNGLGLLAMVVSGIVMSSTFFRQRKAPLE
ncbi:MAG: PepSY domain-containing protein [Synechocystis sp.]|nr:PepSY domain-containing protein [Synechocystis sp.]